MAYTDVSVMLLEIVYVYHGIGILLEGMENEIKYHSFLSVDITYPTHYLCNYVNSFVNSKTIPWLLYYGQKHLTGC